MKFSKLILLAAIISMTASACNSNKGSVYGKKKKGISQPANGRMHGVDK